MIEELKTLIDAVAAVPELVVWVAAVFMFYKLASLGSIVYACLVGWKALMETLQHLQRRPKKVEIGGMVISGNETELLAQIGRIRKATGAYVHSSDIDWLREAIDDKEAKDRAQ